MQPRFKLGQSRLTDEHVYHIEDFLLNLHSLCCSLSPFTSCHQEHFLVCTLLNNDVTQPEVIAEILPHKIFTFPLQEVPPTKNLDFPESDYQLFDLHDLILARIYVLSSKLLPLFKFVQNEFKACENLLKRYDIEFEAEHVVAQV